MKILVSDVDFLSVWVWKQVQLAAEKGLFFKNVFVKKCAENQKWEHSVAH